MHDAGPHKVAPVHNRTSIQEIYKTMLRMLSSMKGNILTTLTTSLYKVFAPIQYMNGVMHEAKQHVQGIPRGIEIFRVGKILIIQIILP